MKKLTCLSLLVAGVLAAQAATYPAPMPAGPPPATITS